MPALDLVADWPVDHVAAAVITATGTETVGDVDHAFRLASLSKPIAAWAVMVAVEESVIQLDGPLQHVDAAPGATMRHLLAHASGFGFDGDQPITSIERTRIYSNTGIERAATELMVAAEMPFDEYLAAAVFQPLGLEHTELRGSPAHGVWSTLADSATFVEEMRRPRLLADETWQDVIRPQYPELAGIVPGVGRFDPCPWGLGVELHGDKSPHWMGGATSPAAFGHFGGAGTMMWLDPVTDTGVVALTDRPFDEWSSEALAHWARLSDAVIAEAAG
jgi:CubicO group peptidase (beta-lactamase class C family)